MGTGRWGKPLIVAMTTIGFVIGVWVASILFAANSAGCDHMERSITLLPPGLRCFGVKDGARHIPWSSADSSPIFLVPIVVGGGGLGALIVGLIGSRFARRAASRSLRGWKQLEVALPIGSSGASPANHVDDSGPVEQSSVQLGSELPEHLSTGEGTQRWSIDIS